MTSPRSGHPVEPPTPEQLLRLAVAKHDAGRLAEAEQMYHAVLKEQPRQAIANHNLGGLAMRRGQIENALRHLKVALEADPAQEQYWLSYVDALIRAGRADAARQMLAQGRRGPLTGKAAEALSARLAELSSRVSGVTGASGTPDVPPTAEMGDLATLFGQRRHAEVEAAAHALTKRFPKHPFAWKVLGASLLQLGRIDDAMGATRNAVALNPHDPDSHFNLGIAFQASGQPAMAQASYLRALEINPHLVHAYNNLGCCLQLQGWPSDAEVQFRKAISLKPDFALAHFNLANALQEQRLSREAEAGFRRALECDPNLAEAHSNLASCLHEQGRIEEAEASCRRALALNPRLAAAHSTLGAVLTNQSRLPEAVAAYGRALDLAPTNLEFRLKFHLLLPAISSSVEEMSAWRARYEGGISALSDTGSMHLGSASENMANPLSFYLAYHNRNDRSTMESLCRLFRGRVAGVAFEAPHLSAWRSPEARKARIRIGFLSAHLQSGHTIGKLYQGLIGELDRARFEVVVVHALPERVTGSFQAIDALADRSVTLPAGLSAQHRGVAAEQLDVLFVPDIGMTPSTYFLAYARLAPVQAASWGHPDTSGLDTVDYFVSAASIEPESADTHYTERLIRLNRLPCFYLPRPAPPSIPTRRAMGLPETGTLYACPQSLFKLHPDFDAVLAEIAEGDPAGHIILLQSDIPVWAELLRQRWAGRFPSLVERVVFLPLQPADRFMALLAHVDVLLDPLHFGSGNTLYEGMVYGTPVVTWPGQFMRGRIVAGAYRQMGVVDAPIAERIEDYAPLALALGGDARRRQRIREASAAAASIELFADTRVVREFEAFLVAAVDAAGRNEKLPVGWRPEIHPRDNP